MNPKHTQDISVLNESAHSLYPGSKKVYLHGKIYPDLMVPVREVSLTASVGTDGKSTPNEPVQIFQLPQVPWILKQSYQY